MEILAEPGMHHLIWNHEDIRFVKNVISGSHMSKMLLKELPSFRTRKLAFTYEILGFTHQDIDIIFDWLRMTPKVRFMGGLDEPDGDAIK